MSLSGRYGVRLRVRGELGPAWSEVFEDLAVEPETDGTTIIWGEVRDQAALFGLFAAIRDLGLSPISIVTIKAPDSRSPQDPNPCRARRPHHLTRCSCR